ncbi:MAG TPA: response regulator [Steroidobacteraceae bacterium]|jgi:CheY-like chemotaxis protein|nr:response regulator [Steroidobacteraceae bacterium]
MAKILVVDDHAPSRKAAVAVLSHDGHVTLEASDGADGLEMAREERPQLVISDILMTLMDGYEFMRQLRADPKLCSTPVIFYTAHYHEREAHKLVEACGVARVLVKPCTSKEMLQAVDQVLTGVSESDELSLSANFDRERLLLITNELAEKVDALAASNARFVALTELNVELASERDPHVLLENVCSAARKLFGSRYAVLAVKEKTLAGKLFFATSGIDFGGNSAPPPQMNAGPLGDVLAARRPLRVADSGHQGIHIGLPGSYPPAGAFLVVPLLSPKHVHGWLCLADKIGAASFDAQDERLLAILGALVGRIYENGTVYPEVQL